MIGSPPCDPRRGPVRGTSARRLVPQRGSTESAHVCLTVVYIDIEITSMRAKVDEVRARLATVTIVDDVAVARLEAAGWTCLPPGSAAEAPG